MRWSCRECDCSEAVLSRNHPGSYFATAAAAQQPQEHAQTTLQALERPTANGANSYYTGNRPPLAPNTLIKLPLGSVRPEGWLRRQLQHETNGFSGKLEELSQFCKFEGKGQTWRSDSSPPHRSKPFRRGELRQALSMELEQNGTETGEALSVSY